jgi:hypothetical protein
MTSGRKTIHQVEEIDMAVDEMPFGQKSLSKLHGMKYHLKNGIGKSGI